MPNNYNSDSDYPHSQAKKTVNESNLNSSPPQKTFIESNLSSPQPKKTVDELRLKSSTLQETIVESDINNRFINGSERFIINAFLNNNLTSQGIYDFNNNQELDLLNNNNLAKITNVNQFRDVNSTDWFYKDLKSLVERFGSLSGYSDQTFQAYKPASRYEIAVLIRYSLSHLNRLLRFEKHNCRNY